MVSTPHGPIHLTPPSPQILSTLQSLTPLGIDPLKESFRGAHYGFIIAKDGDEVMCLYGKV